MVAEPDSESVQIDRESGHDMIADGVEERNNEQMRRLSQGYLPDCEDSDDHLF